MFDEAALQRTSPEVLREMLLSFQEKENRLTEDEPKETAHQIERNWLKHVI